MTGKITISLELELGWGMHDLEDPNKFEALSDGRVAETETLHRLLDVCDELGLPITFDAVGHLLLDSCTGAHDGPYPEGWFDEDPGGDVDSNPLFFAPDLVEAISDADVEHEICTHTFSHILCDETPPTLLDHELDRCAQVHQDAGLSPFKSFVPPRHHTPDRDVLRRHGIETVRVATNEPATGAVSAWAQRARSFSRILGRKHPVRQLHESAGVTETYTSVEPSLTAPFLPTGQAPPHPAFRPFPLHYRKQIQTRYLNTALEDAIRSESHAHLWSHLFNMANEPQWSVIHPFLRRVAAERDRGRISVERMCDLSASNAESVEEE